jgi:hypothetical protein
MRLKWKAVQQRDSSITTWSGWEAMKYSLGLHAKRARAMAVFRAWQWRSLSIEPRFLRVFIPVNVEEKETMCLSKQRDLILRGENKSPGVDRKWIKITITDSFLYFLGIACLNNRMSLRTLGCWAYQRVFGNNEQTDCEAPLDAQPDSRMTRTEGSRAIPWLKDT